MNTSREEKNAAFHEFQKKRITANIVPVWSITSKSVISGNVGSIPISFSATITWAELDTGKSSATP
jgi:hypothetical protein